ncbi:TIGR01458 family HAD-type hydrolase [Methanogenium sp. S4BF]|uniref:TIGR01458 family HAD-type hydrolase n=1 Tax=Methanogenium sp. S4BF TaxID=1789226 RepID=UPI002416E9B5|nr:TIGR01458 family HAD-type hydrolase [Methanogenium sp. S4BF]WFN34220.1 TIGR01458 family HAD-type hydrolase [Methanogenium sp. S4BF]
MTSIKGVLLDIDGVLYTGDSPIPGAGDTLRFLNENEIPFRCISNTTRKSRASISDKLNRYGLDIPEEFIFTPAAALVSILKEKKMQQCFFLTESDVKRDLLVDGITHTISGADAVVVGDAGNYFDYASLNTAFRLLVNGASFFALEKDRYWMDTDGLSLSAGPFVYGLEYAGGVSARLIGKPSPAFFEKALESMKITPSEALMVGDDIQTDIGGAQRTGIKGILVQTGKYDRHRVEQSGIVPYRTIGSVRELPEIISSIL